MAPDAELMKLYGCDHLYRMNNNENPLGPPPAVQAVIQQFPPPKAAIYPNGDAYDLRQDLAAFHHLKPEQFQVGNGADNLIGVAIKIFCESGDNIITADRTFATYEWVATFSGYEARLVPLKDNGYDDQGMLDQVNIYTKLLFICNPNNPTGSYWNETRLRAFLDAIDGQKIVVIDEAYAEFVEQADFPDGISLLGDYPNLIIFRTFSKLYGLAGLRIGYLASSPELVGMLRRAYIVYSVNSLAQAAAAAALGDVEHVTRTRDMVRAAKSYVVPHLQRLGLPHINGEGNFLMIRLPCDDMLAYRTLMAQGVMIRPMTSFRLPNHIRISVAGMDAMAAFVCALETLLCKNQGKTGSG